MRPEPPNDFPVDEYLTRVGLTSRDVENLDDVSLITTLSRAQHQRIPFDNFAMHNGSGVAHNPELLIDRLIRQRRGGVCFEVNGILQLALAACGVHMELRAARVDGGAGFGPHRAHLTLVTPPRERSRVLVDVGFSGELIHQVISTEEPAGHVVTSGELRYQIEPRPRTLAEFDEGVAAITASPDMRFAGAVFCTRPTADGRRTLAGDIDRDSREISYRLIEQGGEHRSQRALDYAEALTVLRDQFDTGYDEVPAYSSLSWVL